MLLQLNNVLHIFGKTERNKELKPEFKCFNTGNKIMQIESGLFRFVVTEIKAFGVFCVTDRL